MSPGINWLRYFLLQGVLVTIEVLDVNDNQPEIEIIYKSAMDTEAQVDEDVGVDEQVVAIRVSDADSGDAGRVSCEMSSENGDEFFKLVRNERASDNMWSVTVRKALKREVRDQYSLSITCKDHGAPSQKISQVSFKVKVMDINDHYPVFFPSTYSTEIQENTSPGTDILQVSATDDDDGYFGDITYRIKTVTVQNPEIPVSLDWFDVTPKGVIRNMVKLDREATPEINMVIEAIDGGTPPNGPFISLATVTIKLLDENDNIPLFNQDVFEASVNNDDLVGTEVIQVKARDFDDGAFGAVSYEIDRSLRGNADHYFEIHHTTGQISVAKALPNTDYQVITLDVVATDGGLLEGSCTVRVSVFGENRYPPIMQHRDFKLTVAENVLTPKILTTVSASDLDDQYFGEVHFEIVGSVDNKFEVDRDSGVLRVVKPLDFEETKIYRFEIRAFNNYDGTLDKKEDRASIVIRITDVNDEPPMFGFDRYNLTAFAGDSDGTIVGIIKAVDPDSGNSGKVTYRLIKGNQELFHLVSTSKGAEIRKNGDLAYLVGDHVNMILEAQDDNEEAFNGDQTVLWIAIKAGAGPGVYEEASSDEGWLDRYLIYFIVAIVALSLMVIVVIVMVCNRASRQNRSHYAASKLPPYDGYDYADLDEQYGLEPDTVKAYNIDGGGECDRLSAFEELTTQLQSLHDVMSEKAYVNNYHGGFPEKKSHIDSDGYFSLSDPAFNEAEKCAEIPPRNGDRTLNSLLNSENIYTNMTHPEKCEIKYGIPLSPPTQHFTDERYPSRGGLDAPPHDMRGTTDPKDFVRCLPPIDNNFVPMSPGPSTPPIVSEPSVRDDQTRPPAEHTASLSSLLSTQSRPSEITRLPTSLMGPNQDELFEERDHQLSEPRNRQLSESLSNQLSESLSNQLSDSRDNQLSESLDPFSDHVVETIRDPREKSRTDTISINSDHSADF